jgi:hypothetical protein
MEQLESQLVTADITLGEDVLDRIDEIVSPGRNVGGADPGWAPPSVTDARLRRR